MQNSPVARKRGRPAIKSTPHPYHHGSLPDALLHAAEAVLRRDGLRGLTLRAIAREAGVSHTAPQHHFGDTAGVLSELAASGHRRLAQFMAHRAAAAGEDRERQHAIAHGYIDFAVENPDLFRLMSRNELLDTNRPSLVEARRMSARGLAGVFETASADEPVTHVDEGTSAFGQTARAQAIAMASAWAYVHGLASLLIDKRLDGLAAATGAFGTPRELVDAVIDDL
ncbi:MULTISPECIES: TetR/AcrR family transcriptional regulator [unclassified Caballeronia]|uniref:TetR/AcrR family transcriptional regulator n=1 Tax=unclassified Caballeronia TaxID=2646786 RepID=UPI00285F9463|nr:MULTISPECIES: TetR/AcrR family transcriptional regulator [unclassified Caballeronia]MDR5739666.1 TetR/AcrR family transcriptional regulator [Caballeronia sp. LZ016]MDR5808132.1 TetR/AcrR family transcriptional regulator [Caballeronia sp. LZ019]